ncbi:hypothetical protein [Adlercreutzia sp. ZJ242]|uniref:hypothetical protein n=1 Tax=Adlercreutzia sp. ZJ242 TaxID=2709409 RepID=UPI0013EB7682|nr:hypothetical protein [Adlercreutzia sp. ZJ242]
MLNIDLLVICITIVICVMLAASVALRAIDKKAEASAKPPSLLEALARIVGSPDETESGDDR